MMEWLTDDEITWELRVEILLDFHKLIFTLIFTVWQTDQWTDRLMDQWTVLKRCYDASSKLSKPPLTLICSKILISLFFLRKRDGRTDGRTDRRTDGPTDRPSYRDSRTHLEMATSWQNHSIVWQMFCLFLFLFLRKWCFGYCNDCWFCLFFLLLSSHYLVLFLSVLSVIRRKWGRERQIVGWGEEEDWSIGD